MENKKVEDLRFDPNYIKAWLYNDKCRVRFTKKDGSERIMICTLCPEFLPLQTDLEEAAGKNREDLVVVWDLEKEAWRSFRFDSVLAFDYKTQYPIPNYRSMEVTGEV